jgi:C4-dicarboxylate-binding protein DctP
MKLSKLSVLLFCLAFFELASAKPIELRFSHVVSPEAPKGQMALKFKELVQQRLGDDKVIVTIYPNSSLFSDSKVMQGLLDNKVELAAPSLSKLKKYSKRFQVFDLPFVFSSSIAAQKFVQGKIGKRLLLSLRKKGFYGLGYLNNGMRQLSSNKMMTLPTDISGLKFRYSGSDVAKSWLESVGAEPQKLSFSKVYESLKAKKIDGQMNVWSNIASKKFHEHQKYILESDHSYLAYVIITSEKFWSIIPPELKVTLEKAMDDAIQYGNEIADQKSKLERQNIIDSNLSEVYKLTVDQRQAWTEAMLPVWEKYEDQIGEGLIQAAASQR